MTWQARVCVIVITVFELIPSSARALKLVGDPTFEFNIREIEIVNGVTYVTRQRVAGEESPTLEIVDFSDPHNLIRLGSFNTGSATGVLEVDDGIAFISHGGSGGSLKLIDVSDPTAPFELGSFPVFDVPDVVATSDDVAYVADQQIRAGAPLRGTLRVLDISNPVAPVEVGAFPNFLVIDIEATDQLGFVSTSSFPALAVFDTSITSDPTQIGGLTNFARGGLAIAHDHLVATGPVGFGQSIFQVIDVRNPSSPLEVSRSAIPIPGSLLEASGDDVFLGGTGFSVVSVADPTAPTRRGSIFAGRLMDMAIDGTHAYVAADRGLRVIDLSILDKPVEVGSLADPNGQFANDVVVSDAHTYLVSALPEYLGTGGAFWIVDVSDSENPAMRGRIDTNNVALDVELVDDRAYIATGTDGIKVINVADPDAPSIVGGAALPGSTAKVEIDDGLAYVVDRGRRFFDPDGVLSGNPATFRILDVSAPATPRVLSSIALEAEMRRCLVPGLAIAGQYAYVTCGRLHVIDISNPELPSVVFSGLFQLMESSVHVAGSLVYVADESSSSLHVVDVSNPAAPSVVSSGYGGTGLAIAAADGYVYTAGRLGLAVYDVADPLKPALLGGYPADSGQWRGVALANGLVYGALSTGLQIVDLGPEYRRVRSVEVAIRAARSVARRNLASRGVMSVAILGAADFDASAIDRSTLRFGPSLAAPTGPNGGILADVNDDGRIDLLSHYGIAETGIAATDTQACVTGSMLDGSAIEGCGSLGVRPRRR